jgi:hypothetical protein
LKCLGRFGRSFGRIDQPTDDIEYFGQVRGNVILGHVKRSMEEATPSLLWFTNEKVKTGMVIDEDQTEIHVMERPDSPHLQFYTLTCSS